MFFTCGRHDHLLQAAAVPPVGLAVFPTGTIALVHQVAVAFGGSCVVNALAAVMADCGRSACVDVCYCRGPVYRVDIGAMDQAVEVFDAVRA